MSRVQEKPLKLNNRKASEKGINTVGTFFDNTESDRQSDNQTYVFLKKLENIEYERDTRFP